MFDFFEFFFFLHFGSASEMSSAESGMEVKERPAAENNNAMKTTGLSETEKPKQRRFL